MADPKYPSPAAGGIIAKTAQERVGRIEAAESAALNPKPATPAPATPSAPPPAPAPSAPSLLDRAKKMVGLKDGGKIPGHGMGDKVHVMAEPGEYMLPKDTVKKVGGAKSLDHLVKKTHNPSNRTPFAAKHKPGSRGM
jgi:hypothetical protein